MHNVAIKNIDSGKSLIENDQTSDLTMAMAVDTDGVFENIIPFIKCRDFFNDMTHCQRHGINKVLKYGFAWKYSEDLNTLHENTGTLHMLLDAYGSSYDNINDNLAVLHDVEALFGMEVLSKLEETLDPDGGSYWLLESDARWFDNGVLMSLYTWVIRLLTYDLDGKTTFKEVLENVKAKRYLGHTDNPLYTSSDGNFSATFINKFDIMMLLADNWKTIIGKSPYILQDALETYEMITHIHDGGGIYSFITGYGSGIDVDECEPAVLTWVTNLLELKKQKEAA